MNKQRGVAISDLILWGIVFAMFALLGMKAGPEYLEFYRIQKCVNSIATGSSDQTVASIRNAFDRYANINYIRSFEGKDLDISKEGNGIVIAFAYERRVPLFFNVSLLLEFEGRN